MMTKWSFCIHLLKHSELWLSAPLLRQAQREREKKEELPNFTYVRTEKRLTLSLSSTHEHWEGLPLGNQIAMHNPYTVFTPTLFGPPNRVFLARVLCSNTEKDAHFH